MTPARRDMIAAAFETCARYWREKAATERNTMFRSAWLTRAGDAEAAAANVRAEPVTRE